MLAIIGDFLKSTRQGSTMAPVVDLHFGFIILVMVFFGALVFFLVALFAVLYRRKDENEIPVQIHGNNRLEIIWSVVPLFVLLVICFWGFHTYFALSQPPDDCMEIYVVGRQWMWKVQHPTGQKEINRLTVPAGTPVKLIMTSEDVIHSFGIPAFRVKQDTVPGRYSTMWFNATTPGDYHLFCDQYCGTEHAKMRGTVRVLSPSDYQEWLSEKAEGSMALQGRKLVTKLQCIACHYSPKDGAGTGPNLENIYQSTVLLRDGARVVANEQYLRESIQNPSAKVVNGFQYPSAMPAYVLKDPHNEASGGQLDAEELNQVIEFLKVVNDRDENLRWPTRIQNAPIPVPTKAAE